jgi:uncharacterized OB-fold protein
MPINERITSTEDLRSWTDRIPLRYEYTAGVAGERFLQSLKKGTILAGTCSQCGKRYVPPKSYCVDCFKPIDDFEPIGPRGTVAALTESWVDFGGKRLKSPSTFAFVVFKGTVGGLIQKVEGEVRIGSTVEPRFAPEPARKGSLSDIEKFFIADTIR